ncbi:acetylornithine deacetylase [Pararhodobacter oceanensis]|uniref:Acetylornithine deacetylase n=1 Tax=Pararhodobacter oceanensis TaxID=2172121 RepID=A0A2T8HYR7_9RHOB|nr:acetylornithine deacetylase [Pararhodobacter oceanensis]PVH30586.1 acetylornithine deacetylase [Pararhodobacter oceanensis]
MTDLSETRAILGDLISYPTVSWDSNLAMIGYLADRLETAGARVEMLTDPTGAKANLWATIGPEGDGGLVLSGHSDVVPAAEQVWASDPFLMDERDGALYGRGTCDMKGFIAATVAMAPHFAAANPKRPIHFAFTYDEEVGCLGGGALVAMLRERGLTPAMALLGEPTEMRVIEGHKGCCEYSTYFTGLEGHGSGPDLGVNAVEFAVRYVTRLLALKDELRARCRPDSRFDPPWTTINTGALVGGVAHNVIPGRARVDWEMRPVHWSDADFVKSELAAFCEHDLLPAMRRIHPEAQIETEVIGEVIGLEPMQQNEIRDLVMELTGANDTDLVAFNTEAGLYQTLGVDVVVCGPGSIAQAHKPDEFVTLAQLEQCLSLLHRLIPRAA